MDFWLLDRQNKEVQRDLDRAYERVVRSGQFIIGKENIDCEGMMQKMFGVKHVILTSSGTSALEIVLRNSNDLYWRVPSVSFIATENAVINARKEHGGYGFEDPVLSVDLYGLPAEPGKIRDSCQAHNLALMKMLPGVSDAATLSFFPTKAVGALGDAGAILTNSDTIADDCRELRNQGRANHKGVTGVGTNARCDELQAAFIKVKLARFPRWQTRRVEICEMWDEASGYKYGEWGPYLYPVWHPDRDKLQQELTSRGVPTKVYYREPLHSTEKAVDFCNKVLCLNPDPFLTKEESNNVYKELARHKDYFLERPEL